MKKPSETACRDLCRSGLASSVPRSNSVRIVARLMIRNSEPTRLEIVSSVRRLFRRMFLKISFAYFIRSSPSFESAGFDVDVTHRAPKGSAYCSHKRHKKHKRLAVGFLCFSRLKTWYIDPARSISPEQRAFPKSYGAHRLCEPRPVVFVFFSFFLFSFSLFVVLLLLFLF